MKSSLKLAVTAAIILVASGCAYYNTFFNTKKFFDEAEKARIEEEKKKATRVGSNRTLQTREQRQQSRSRVSSAVKGKYNKAIEKASRLLEFYPESKYVDDALLILGKSFYYRDEYRKARRKFEELINNFPESEFIPEARLWLGKVHTELRDYATAEQNFKDILATKSKRDIRDEAQFLLGGLYLHKQDYFSAANEFKVAAQNANDKKIRCEAFYQLGKCHMQLKNFTEAAKAFEMSKKYSPDTATEYRAQFHAGLAYKALGQYETAIKIYTDLLGDFNNEENWPDCKLEIADCLNKMGDVDNAIGWYVSIPEDHKNARQANARAYYNLGLIYQLDKADFKQAKEYFDEAVKLAGRTDFGEDAKNHQKSVQNILKLQEDIEAQLKRIRKGDSLAAVVDQEEVVVKFKTMQEEMLLDKVLVDSLWTLLDDTTSERLADSLDVERLYGEDRDKAESKIVKRYFLFDSLFVDSLMTEHEFLLNKADEIIAKANSANSLNKGDVGTPEEEIIKDRLMLGEIYMIDIGQPDSALAQYLDVLKRDTTATNRAKALYSIGYIYEKMKNDSTRADSVYQEILTRFPDSEYADRLREKLNIATREKTSEQLLDEFITAEKYYFDLADYDSAIARYEKIVQLYPESPYASKSLFAVGWIYENDLHENEKALETYRKLLETYPESEIAKHIKKKVDAVEQQSKQTEQGPTEQDSTLLADTSTNSALSEQTGQQEYDIQDIIHLDNASLREMLRREMEKDNPRLRNPNRIIRKN